MRCKDCKFKVLNNPKEAYCEVFHTKVNIDNYMCDINSWQKEFLETGLRFGLIFNFNIDEYYKKIKDFRNINEVHHYYTLNMNETIDKDIVTICSLC